jgi:hypothetical protein
MTRALLLYQMFFYYSLTHPLFTVQTDDYLYNIGVRSDHPVKSTGHVYASVSVCAVRLCGL